MPTDYLWSTNASKYTSAVGSDIEDSIGVADYGRFDTCFGRTFLRNWQAQLAHIRQATPDKQAVLALLGDSWINTPTIFVNTITSWLQTEYGDAGPGWCSASEGANVATANVARVRAGTWTDRTHATDPKGRGPDVGEALSTDEATPASLSYTATMRGATIHYLKQSGGGSFRYQVDSDGWTTIDTSNASDLYATEAITGLSDDSHELQIEVVAASTGGVVLFGVDFQETGNGVRVHKLGQGGARSSSFTSIPSANFAAAITALAPTTVLILLGTNDDDNDIAPAIFRTNMEAIASRVVSASPLTDILFVAPGPNGKTVGAYGMGDYVAQLRASAVTNSYACFDSYLLLGNYAASNSRGLWTNTGHVNGVGGGLMAREIINSLLYVL